MGEAVLRQGTMPPHVNWSVPAGPFRRSVYAASDLALYRKSQFRRRLEKDCRRVGWGPQDAKCFAIALCFSKPNRWGDVEIRLVKSYDDLFILPRSGVNGSVLSALLDKFANDLQANVP